MLLSFFNQPEFGKQQARREIAEFIRLAADVRKEGKYATAEKIMERANEVAEKLVVDANAVEEEEDLANLINVRYCLASDRIMQGKFKEALPNYIWLIALSATNHTNSPLITTGFSTVTLLSNEKNLHYITKAYVEFVNCGRFLSEMKVEKLHQVVNEGLAWLDQIGKNPDWSSGFRLLRGLLYREQGEYTQAREEIETSIALRKRYSQFSNYTLATHLLHLGSLLFLNFFKEWGKVEEITREVLAPEFRAGIYDRTWAYRLLSYALLKQGKLEEAEQTAQQILNSANNLESNESLINTYLMLAQIYKGENKLELAVSYTAKSWYYSRKIRNLGFLHDSLLIAAWVRLAQAKAISSVKADDDNSNSSSKKAENSTNQSQTVLSVSSFSHARNSNQKSLLEVRRSKKLESVKRFVNWATPLAIKLDAAADKKAHVETLEEIMAEVAALERKKVTTQTP